MIPKMTARLAEKKIAATLARFSQQPDAPNQRIHALFAGLYLQTTSQWLSRSQKSGNAEFAYLVIAQFHELYDQGVLAHLNSDFNQIPVQWRQYHRLARRLTIASPISMHLLLLSIGARAHIRYDLAIAVYEAAKVAANQHKIDIDIYSEMEQITGPVSSQAFVSAALEYTDQHRNEQSGWRRQILRGYSILLRISLPLWLGFFQSWRRTAFAEARRWIVLEHKFR